MQGFIPTLRAAAVVLAISFVSGCRVHVPTVRVAPLRLRAPAARPYETPLLVGKINDANVIAVLMASCSTDISYANLVAARSTNPAVIAFAARMALDHSGVNAMALKLASSVNIDPKENSTSLDMRELSAIHRDRLRDLTGSAFDTKYVDNEIAWHKQFLSTIDDVLLPYSEDGQLRQLLAGIRPAVVAHLAHAEQLRASLGAK